MKFDYMEVFERSKRDDAFIAGSEIRSAIGEAERSIPTEVKRVIDAAKGMVGNMPILECADFHHDKKDQHGWDEDCKPLVRYNRATSALFDAIKGMD